MKKNILIALCGFLISPCAFAQQSIPIPLNNTEAFEAHGKNWTLASDISIDPSKSNAKLSRGTGILVNLPNKEVTDLVSKIQLSGDFELDFDFMTSKGGQSAVYLLGRYKILLSDAWPAAQRTTSGAGTVYYGSGEENPSFFIQQPLSHVAKAPGLWQQLKVLFRAAEFAATGEKTKNAMLEAVYLNGVLIHQDLALVGPSSDASFQDEQAAGPLVIKGDDQHAMAITNIHYKELSKDKTTTSELSEPGSKSPILIQPGLDPYLVRSYLLIDGHKRTHVISVGNPSQTHFSYDLKQGSILQFWRGDFVDATQMWESRGEPQLVQPLGAVISLSPAPTLAQLASEQTNWPDSIPFDDLQNKGYSLDKAKNPTFHYEYAGLVIQDAIHESGTGEGLKRSISISGSTANLYMRIAKGKTIESLGNGLYAIDGKSYYIKIDERFKPLRRSSQGMDELLLAFDGKQSAIDYSIIW